MLYTLAGSIWPPQYLTKYGTWSLLQSRLPQVYHLGRGSLIRRQNHIPRRGWGVSCLITNLSVLTTIAFLAISFAVTLISSVLWARTIKTQFWFTGSLASSSYVLNLLTIYRFVFVGLAINTGFWSDGFSLALKALSLLGVFPVPHPGVYIGYSLVDLRKRLGFFRTTFAGLQGSERISIHASHHLVLLNPL